ncbi:hypothetical protein QUC31_013301 [Theobroma cacao]
MSFGLVSCRSMSAGQTGILFVHPEDNVTYKLSSTLTVLPPGSSSVDELSHIPSPYGAASLPLPSGTGHETLKQQLLRILSVSDAAYELSTRGFQESNMSDISSCGSSDKDVEPFVEVDPTGRFGRYPDLLGAGATKQVYRAFDQEEGREVAWNQISLTKFMDNDYIIKKLYAEVGLLAKLDNKNVISLFSYWTDYEHNRLNFITEVCTSGNLRDYRKKHRRYVTINAVKMWSRQILKGLEYLHMPEPCIIHRDLNCSNVFINGNAGEIKIGDFGFATVVGKNHIAQSVIGTPEFMAPELFEENYTEAVDIYSFGMCLLELITQELPYSECDSIAKIYKKVSAGGMPEAIDKVKDPKAKAIIKKCLVKQSERPSATQLLADSFFHGLDQDENYDEAF